jgi:hypothetical protein
MARAKSRPIISSGLTFLCSNRSSCLICFIFNPDLLPMMLITIPPLAGIRETDGLLHLLGKARVHALLIIPLFRVFRHEK